MDSTIRVMPVSCPGLRSTEVLRRLPVRLPQLSVKARLAHSACFAAVALREVMTTGRTIELSVRSPQWPFELAVASVPHWTHFSPMIWLHRMQIRVMRYAPKRNELLLGDSGECHTQLTKDFAWASPLSRNLISMLAAGSGWGNKAFTVIPRVVSLTNVQ